MQLYEGEREGVMTEIPYSTLDVSEYQYMYIPETLTMCTAVFRLRPDK